MKRYLYIALIAVVALLASCEKEQVDYSRMSTPQIDFVLNGMTVDLNKADNLPVVAVIFSEAGLNRLDMYLLYSDGREDLYKSETKFYDPKKHSIKETPTYTSALKGVRLEATDLGGRVETKSLDISIIPFQNPPTVVFDPERIVIDERNGVLIPNTKFTATASGSTKLARLSAVLFSASGKTTILSETFTENDTQPESYSFDQLIEYKEGDRSLQVTVTDLYNKVTIAALPIEYIAIPAPVVTDQTERIVVDTDASAQVAFKATSEVGIVSVVISKVVKGVSTQIKEKSYDKQLTIDFDESILFDDNQVSSLKVVVIDKNGKSTQFVVSTIVGMKYLANYKLGGQYYIKGYTEDPEHILHIFSVAKMSGITLKEAYDNRADGDLHFFMYDQSASCLRLNSWGQQENASQMNGLEYQDLPDIPTAFEWTNRNLTTLLELNPDVHGFTFEEATAHDLRNFNKALITTLRVTNPGVGKVYLVKTAASSSAGEQVGLIKVENLVTPSTTSVSSLPFENRYNYTKGSLNRRASVVEVSVKFPK